MSKYIITTETDVLQTSNYIVLADSEEEAMNKYLNDDYVDCEDNYEIVDEEKIVNVAKNDDYIL